MPTRRRAGYTLVEVVFSILVTAVIVSSVMTVMVSVQQGDVKADRKLVAGTATSELEAILKNFQRPAGYSSGPLLGPNAYRVGVARWHLHGMGGISDGMGDVDALTPGTHVLTGFLPQWFEAGPFNARIQYTVGGALGTAQKIDITVNWDEP